MDKLYNKAFKIGVCFNILLFGVLNSISFIVAHNDYLYREIRFTPGYAWGFPLRMFRYGMDGFFGGLGFDVVGLLVNGTLVIISSFIAGFTFRFVWSKISQRFVKLK